MTEEPRYEFESGSEWLKDIEGEMLPLLITSDKPLIRVVAGPGSGKTLGLRKRVQRLIQGDGVSPEKIFVGTFTRAIANDLAKSLGGAIAEGVEIRTLHSLAYRLLLDNPSARQGRTLRFLLDYETAPMLYDVGEHLQSDTTQTMRKN